VVITYGILGTGVMTFVTTDNKIIDAASYAPSNEKVRNDFITVLTSSKSSKSSSRATVAPSFKSKSKVDKDKKKKKKKKKKKETKKEKKKEKESSSQSKKKEKKSSSPSNSSFFAADDGDSKDSSSTVEQKKKVVGNVDVPQINTTSLKSLEKHSKAEIIDFFIYNFESQRNKLRNKDCPYNDAALKSMTSRAKRRSVKLPDTLVTDLKHIKNKVQFRIALLTLSRNQILALLLSRATYKRLGLSDKLKF
jgi:mannitol-specific phosphotransferase system IIBC component